MKPKKKIKVSLIAVMSINGKITRGAENSSVEGWASEADSNFFRQMLANNRVSIMGNTTYKVNNIKPKTNKLRIVLTRRPEDFDSIETPNQIEFTDKSPQQIISDIEKRGFNSALVLGGSQIYGLFLESGLVTDLYITLEPLIFGDGHDLLNLISKNLNFKLISSDIMNKQGSLLLHYESV